MRNRLLLAIAVLLIVMTASSVAMAGRKRVVVLEFDGPKAEKFHDDIVKLLKKHHTVIPTDKWTGTADELDAGKLTEKNVKKVAKKLKVDGVISGTIEKRRDEYIIRLKLRAGTSGELIGNSIETKADGPRLDGKAAGDLKDELIGQIDDLESNHGGGGDDEADKPSKRRHDDDADDEEADSKPSKKKHDDDEGDDEDRHSGFSRGGDDMKGGDKVGKKSKKSDEDEDEDAPKKSKKDDKKKKSDDEDSDVASTKHDDDESPLPKSKKHDDESDDSSDEDSGDGDKPKKRVAHKDDDEDDDGGSVDSSSDDDSGIDKTGALSPARRAIDVSAGLSFTGRSLGFQYKSTLSTPPPGYKQAIPVAGGTFDVTFYPLAFNKKNKAITSGIGLEVLYDKALKINSQKRYIDNAGAGQVANLATAESRLKVAAVFRYPLGKGANAPVVGGKLGYQTKRFNIEQTLPNMDATDVPNVYYKMIEPEAFLIYPASPKINIGVNAGFLAISDTGDIQKSSQYGGATVSGFEFAAGVDYNVTKNIFVRGQGLLQTIGFKFKGDAMSKSNTRDNDPGTQEVLGARDTYFGGAVTIGYIY